MVLAGVFGFEPKNDGVKVRCVSHFTTPLYCAGTNNRMSSCRCRMIASNRLSQSNSRGLRMALVLIELRAQLRWRREQHSKLIPDGYASLSRRAAVLRRSLSMVPCRNCTGNTGTTTVSYWLRFMLLGNDNVISGGAGRIRTHGTLLFNSFQDCSHRPLDHCAMFVSLGAMVPTPLRTSRLSEPSDKLWRYNMIYAMEPPMGVEPTLSPWKGDVLPLNHGGIMGISSNNAHVHLSGLSVQER